MRCVLSLLLIALCACTYQALELSPDGRPAGDRVESGDRTASGDSFGDGDKVAGDSSGDPGDDPQAGDTAAGDTLSCPPPIQITDPPAGHAAQYGIDLSGTCGANDSWITIGGDVGTTTTTQCTLGQFTATITFSPIDEQKTIQAIQLPDEPCESSSSRTFERKFCSETALMPVSSFPAGSGTAGDPWIICTGTQLVYLANTSAVWGDHFLLQNDIVVPGAGPANMPRIGSLPIPFVGHFDGGGHTIAGVTIRQSADEVGLFQRLDTGAWVGNVVLEDADLMGNSNVGAVVGLMLDGTLDNVTVVNPLIRGTQNVGGLVGRHSGGNIISPGATDVVVTGSSYVGGLVGLSEAEITGGNVTGSMSVSGGDRVGGLVGVGNPNSTLSDTTVSVACSSPCVVGATRVGGALGEHSGSLYQVAVTLNGTVGIEVSGNYAGGLIGYAAGQIDTASVNVFVAPSSVGVNVQYAGGIAGWTDHTIIESSSTGQVAGDARVGGIVGELASSGQVLLSYSWMTVIAEDTSAGGLVGRLEGGLVGDSSAHGDVQANNEAGGIVGILWTGSVLTSYATGDVTAITSTAGGVAGAIDNGSITNSYSLSDVSVTYFDCGGIVGYQTGGDITNCHHTVGALSAGSGTPAGIVASWASGSTTHCFFTGNYDSTHGGTELSASDMQNEGSFVGWGFDTIWKMDTTNGYPVLMWQP